MKPLIKAALIAVMLIAAPAWAHGGHSGWRDGHRYHHPHWKHGHHKHHGHARHSRGPRRVVEHVYRYEPYPAQSASVSPGIHVIFPDVYFPWPQ